MEIAVSPAVVVADRWFVVFHPEVQSRFINRFMPGPYKHVSAFAFVPGAKVWVEVQPSWFGIYIQHLSQQAIEALFRGYIRAGCAVVKIEAGEGPMPWWTRLTFQCVTVIKHLIRRPCVSATPFQFYRFLIQNGGMRVGGSFQT